MAENENPAILHIASQGDWESAQKAGAYRVHSLETEGFIHCSVPRQILDVANRLFKGREDLVLLEIDPVKLKAPLRWEHVEEEIYPHVYGPIDLEAVVSVVDFPPGPDGAFWRLP